MVIGEEEFERFLFQSGEEFGKETENICYTGTLATRDKILQIWKVDRA